MEILLHTKPLAVVFLFVLTLIYVNVINFLRRWAPCSNSPSPWVTSCRRPQREGCRRGSGLRVRIWRVYAPPSWRTPSICTAPTSNRVPRTCCSRAPSILILWTPSTPPMFWGGFLLHIFKSCIECHKNSKIFVFSQILNLNHRSWQKVIKRI